MAGESAHELARRKRDKAERLLRSAEMYERGGDGERVVGAILDQLRQEGWAVFHDVRWPGRPRANLDHVIVGPPGVFVIDAKNWSGRIEVRDQTFRRDGRRQDRTVAAAGEAALAVQPLLGPDVGATTRSVLCFVRDEPLAGWCYDVMVCSTGNLREMLLGRPPVLTPVQVRTAAVELHMGFRAAEGSVAGAPPRHSTRSTPTPGQFLGAVAAASRSRSTASRRRSSRRAQSRGCVGPLMRFGLAVLACLLALSFLPRIADLVGQQLTQSLTPATKAYSSCAALRQDFPHGVGTRAGVRHALGKHPRVAVEPEVYRANTALDVDKDGMACEKA